MNWEESIEIQVRELKNLINNGYTKEGVNKQLEISKKISGFHFFTGIGKNGFVAAKVASTFNSLGIRSLFIDPVNTLHGDMNIFTSNDIVLVLSKSGETEELITFLRALHKINFKNITAIVSNPNSTIAKMASHVIFVPINHEGDELNLAPVSSSVVFMALLQAIAVDLSSQRGFTKEEFVRGHPGGSLGKIKV